LTRDRVAQVLNCSCDHCHQQRRNLRLVNQPSEYIDSILDARLPSISLFALLIFIRAPPLVVGFLDRRVHDQSMCDLPENFRVGNVGETYWSHFHRRRREDSESLEDEFRNHLFQFAVLTFTSRRYHVFHKQTILPFIEQRQLGKTDEDGRVVNEGAYGTVYACKIWPAYNTLFVSSLHTAFKNATTCTMLTSRWIYIIRIPKELNGSPGRSWTCQLDYSVWKRKT
jgi:hypothetical protein